LLLCIFTIFEHTAEGIDRDYRHPLPIEDMYNS